MSERIILTASRRGVRARGVGSLLCLVLTVLFLLQALPAGAAGSSEPLASWQGPARERILAFVRGVSTPGDPAWLPPRERVAVFDWDGTLISERPYHFAMHAAMARLFRLCPGLAQRDPEAADLCRAAKERDRRYLYMQVGRTMSVPFAGMTFSAYRNHLAEVFARAENPDLKRAVRYTLYQPMLELISYLTENGFSVWLDSTTDQCALQAVSRQYLGIPEEHCIGSDVWAELSRKDGRLVVRRALQRPPVNHGEAKVVNLLKRLGRRPILAAGNSGNDLPLLEWTSENTLGSLCLVVDHDDPREFAYKSGKILRTAAKRGWLKVSMAKDWRRLYNGPQ